jgi:hypothetical protein
MNGVSFASARACSTTTTAVADAAGARLFVPVHHQTFQLSHEPFDEPIARAEAALAAERGRLVVRHVGDTSRIV